jgi:ribonuclease HI
VSAILHDLRAVENAIRAHATTTARKLARVIGTLSATRLQHHQASLHLHSLDSFKTTSVAAAGWDGDSTPMTEQMLTDISWWKQTIAANLPRRLDIPPPEISIFTDASPIGWRVHVRLPNDTHELVMHGVWKKKATSNSLECQAVERALRRLRQIPQADSVSSVLVRSDNTSTCYNINRQAACDTLMPALTSLLRFAERANLHLTAEHISGVDNGKADRLSRISPGGDYSLKTEVLQQLLQCWKVQIGADLFAAGWNAKHALYCSTASREQERLPPPLEPVPSSASSSSTTAPPQSIAPAAAGKDDGHSDRAAVDQAAVECSVTINDSTRAGSGPRGRGAHTRKTHGTRSRGTATRRRATRTRNDAGEAFVVSYFRTQGMPENEIALYLHSHADTTFRGDRHCFTLMEKISKANRAVLSYLHHHPRSDVHGPEDEPSHPAYPAGEDSGHRNLDDKRCLGSEMAAALHSEGHASGSAYGGACESSRLGRDATVQETETRLLDQHYTGPVRHP